ncbi:histidine phosphatase superfamily [Coemansia spiralis]|nr:histidine phosphatase superfamily [Coemansia spiralis]
MAVFYSSSMIRTRPAHTAVTAGNFGTKKLSLSTKAPYPDTKIPNIALPRSFELVQVQQLTRHGARYPTLAEIDELKRVYKLAKPYVPSKWLVEDLVDARNAGLLAESGRQEIARIAERSLRHYNQILKEAIGSSGSVRFVSSERQRTQDSAREFWRVLSTINAKLPPVTVLPQANDTILSMHHICPVWLRDSALVQQHVVVRELQKFDSINGRAIQEKIKRRLGSAKTAFTMDDVQTMYTLCAYDISLYQEPNYWCTLFDSTTADYLELRKDIYYSRMYGPYGANINKRMACALMTDMLRDIDLATTAADSRRAVSTFRFGHAETVMFVSALLRLEDTLGSVNTPIVGNMTLADARQRGFKTTMLAPFSANLILELYRHGQQTYYFRLLLNEQPIRLSVCDDDICQLDILRNELAAHVGCNFNQICKVE